MLPIGHTGTVYIASFSPDGKYILTASADGTAKVWNAIRGQLITDLAGHTNAVGSASFSPDGKYIVTASIDSIAKVWNTVTGQLVADLKGHTNLVRSASFSPDGKHIVTASMDKTAKVWNALSGKLVTDLKGHTNWVESASFSPACPNDPFGGKYIVTASDDSTARVWNAVSGQLVANLKGHTHRVWKASFSPDGKYIVTASWDKTARVWNAVSGMLIADLKGHTDRIRSVSFSPACPDDPIGGKYIVTASDDKTARVWNALSGRLVADLKGHANPVQSASFSPNGKYIVTASMDKTAKVWNALSGKLVADLKEHTNWVASASFSSDGKYIVTGSYDNTAKLWNTVSGQLIADLKGHSHRVYTASFSPDGKYIVTVSSDSTAKVWNAVNGRLVTNLKEHSNNVRSASFSPACPDDSAGGKYLLTTSFDNTARVWNAVDGQLITDLKGHADRVYRSFFFPDGKHIITASDDSTVKVWNAIGGQLITDLKGHFNYVRSVSFSPDGKYIVTASSDKAVITASSDKTAKVWNAVNGKLVADLYGHTTGVVQSTSFSPACPDDPIGGKYIVTTASFDNTARVWETLSGRLVADLKGHTNRVLSASFSPDGKYIITTSQDSTAKVWNAVGGQFLATLKGHTYWVNRASFSPDGKKIITVSFDKTAKVWNTVNRQLIKTIEGNGGYFGDIDFNNKRIICLYNSEVSIHDVESGKKLYTYFAVDSSDYLVYDKDNRYDGTPAARKLLYFICGREIIELDRVKDQLWVPNLAERVMNGETINAQKLSDLNICGLTPEVEDVSTDKNEYHFKIKARRGGLGETVLYINGIEARRYKPAELKNNAGAYDLVILKAELKNFFIPGKKNPVTVKAYTSDNAISSRGLIIQEDEITTTFAPPNLFAVMVGVSDYKDDKLDLGYAAIDATDISTMLADAAKKLLGKEHVFMYNLTTAKDHYLYPEKNSIKKVLENIGRKATANDILFIFLSGHGVMKGEDKKQFYYLTADAADFDAYEVAGISTTELTEWIKPQNIKAQKRVLILDACQSGQAINDLVTLRNGQLAAKGDDKEQQIKAIDKLNEKSGLFILSASASNKSAFEAPMYEHGFLTYSLLKAIKQQPDILEDGRFLNVSRWFNAAGNTVRDLAKDLGEEQQTQIIATTDFNIGVVDAEVMAKITLSEEKPLFTSSNFQNNDEAISDDDLDLSKQINTELDKSSSGGAGSKIVFAMAIIFPEAYYLTGRYIVKGNEITVNVNVKQNKQIKYSFQLKGTKDKLIELVSSIAEKAAEWAVSNKATK